MRGAILTLTAILALGAVAGAGAVKDDGDELKLKKMRVVNETPLGGDRWEWEITGDLKNKGSATWEWATATLDLLRAGELGVEVVGDHQLDFGSIDPRDRVSATDTVTLRGTRRALKKTLKRAGKGKKATFEVRGREITVYTGPPAYLDDPTDEAFAGIRDLIPGGNRKVLTFGGWTDLLRGLAPGHLLLPSEHEMENDRAGAWHLPVVHVTRSLLPAEVMSVAEVGGAVEVEIITRELLEVVESGSFSIGAEYLPEGHGLTTFVEDSPSLLFFVDRMFGCEDESFQPPSGTGTEPTECGFKALPIRFNDVTIGPGLTVSGELLLHSAGVQVDVRIRRFRLEKATADLAVSWSTTLEVRAEQGASFDTGEHSLFELPLAVYTLYLGPIPVVVSPIVEMKLGASADLQAGVVFSVHQRGMVGMVVGWDDGRYLAEPYSDVEPLAFTPPRLTDDTRADGKAWAALALVVEINGSAGPYLEARMSGDLSVRPGKKTWWKMEAGAEVVGGFQLEILGWNIAKWESKLFGDETGADESDRSDPARTSGETARWGLALSDGAGSGTHERQKIVPLADGGALIMGRNTTAGYLVKVDAKGNVLWEMALPQSTAPVGAVELANGHLVVAGERGASTWIAEHDASGQRLWFNSIETDPACTPRDVAAITDENGDPGFVVVGRATLGTVRERDPCVIRFGETGTVVWAKRYESPGEDWPYAVTVPDGGTILLGGVTGGYGAQPGSDGLLAAIDLDGAVTWAHAIGTNASAHLEDVITTEDGRIFACGTNPRPVNRDHPTHWIVRAEADGSGIRNVLLEENWEYPERLGPTGAPTTGGNTPYDTGYALARAPGGIVVVGSTGLGDARAGWAAKLNEDLGVIWMTAFDGPLADIPWAVAHVDGGILMAGSSRSFVPSGTGGDSALFVAKLPEEGRIEFLPGAATPSFYLPPSTKSGDSAILSNGALVNVILGTEPITFTVIDLVVSAGTEPALPAPVTSTVTRLTE